jgi:hypothetical protein
VKKHPQVYQVLTVFNLQNVQSLLFLQAVDSFSLPADVIWLRALIPMTENDSQVMEIRPPAQMTSNIRRPIWSAMIS